MIGDGVRSRRRLTAKSKRYFVLNGTISSWWIPERVSSKSHDQEKISEIINLVHPSENEEIIDAGCGYGRLSIPLAKKGAQITSLDINTEMLKMCDAQAKLEQVADKIRLVLGDIEELPFDDSRFDKSVSIGTLEHVPDYEEAIKELIRVTRIGGIIVVATTSLLHPTILKRWLKHRLVNRRHEGTCKESVPIYPPLPWQILKALEKHGAKVLSYHGFYILLPYFIAKRTNTFSFGLKDFPVLKFFSGLLFVKAFRSK